MTSVYEYFAAASDEDAVRVLQGSSSGDAIDGSGIQPAVNLADLEELLTGATVEQILENPRAGETLAGQADTGMIITVTDTLQAALAAIDDNSFAPLAAEWSHAEEFGGEVSPADLHAFLGRVSALARRASERNERLYCRGRF